MLTRSISIFLSSAPLPQKASKCQFCSKSVSGWESDARTQNAAALDGDSGPMTALTGVMLKQQLRREQDTRALPGVVYDTYLMPSQLQAVVAPKAQTQAYIESGSAEETETSAELPFIWSWEGMIQGFLAERRQVGDLLAQLTKHMDELNKVTFKDKCTLVKHCGVDRGFH